MQNRMTAEEADRRYDEEREDWGKPLPDADDLPISQDIDPYVNPYFVDFGRNAPRGLSDEC